MDLESDVAIWDEPFLQKPYIDEVRQKYVERFDELKNMLITNIQRVDGVELIVIITSHLSSPYINSVNREYMFLEDKPFLNYLLILSIKYANLKCHNKVIPLNEIEKTYNNLIKSMDSIENDFLDFAKNGKNQKKVLINNQIMIECQENIHHKLINRYALRKRFHDELEHPLKNLEGIYKDLIDSFQNYEVELKELYGYNIYEIIQIIDNISKLAFNKILNLQKTMNHDKLDLSIISLSYDELNKIDSKLKFINNFVIDFEKCNENIFNNKLLNPIIKKDNHYIIPLTTFASSISEVIAKDLHNKDTKKYKGNPFEKRIQSILNDKHIPFKSNLHKELNRKCEIDILFEDDNSIFILDSKSIYPTAWFQFPPMRVIRAQKQYKEFEKDFIKKEKVIKEQFKNKNIIRILVSFYPLYVSHYLNYLCMTPQELLFWLENYYLKKKNISSVNAFFEDYIKTTAKQLRIDLSNNPPENVNDINLRDYY